ncbi:MAG TPA: hypothetical protein VFW66_04275 [Gemmatimonadales bacterium]|nr:hypothetical protein [Gemmatimonadales bacterium]
MMKRQRRDDEYRDDEFGNRDYRGDALPESGMGGASDSGASEGDPASHPQAIREGLPLLPENPIGDAEIERRHHLDPSYAGPERRQGRR